MGNSALLKNWHQLSYAKLAFLSSDSQSFRRFARLPWHWSPSASCLQENISRIQASTWGQINRLLVGWADRQGLERGRKIRADATAVESHIPYPTDSQLLSDEIRVLTRTLRRLARRHKIVFRDHQLRAKRRCMDIRNDRGARRREAYGDLLKVARKTAHYTRMALQQAHRWTDPRSQARAGKLRHTLDLMMRIIDQTERRVLHGESVPAQEKAVSLFEAHTDIIKKKRRETVFGHKLYLTGGVSGLILDFEVVRGNPNDAAQFQPWIQRQYDLYGRWPRQASFDGCFASKTNLQWAKDQGIRDVAFAKKRGLKVRKMVRSSWVYRQLRRFRAGIEGAHLDAQASLRSPTLHLERLGPLSTVCGPLDHQLQLAGPGPPAALSAALNSIARRRLSGTRVSKNRCCPSEESKILLSTQPTPLYCSFGPLPHPIQSLKIGLSG